MRVLQIITSLRMGGAEKLITEMLPFYKRAGIEVDLLLFDGSDTPLKETVKKSGIKIIEFSKNKNVYQLSYIYRLIPIMRKYDIVHTHNTAPQFFAAIANIFCKTKLVTTEHSTSNRRRKCFFKFFDRWMYRQYCCIICISSKTKQNLVSYLGFCQHMVVVNNGIDCCKFQQAKRFLYSKKNIITMVAGFRKEKDQDTLVKAFNYLSKDKYELWLVGIGERECVVKQLVKDEGLERFVKFLGLRSDVPNILKSSDIVVMSSHWEGFGLAAVEGMAAGKPVIASNVDGLAQVVKGAGILFEKGDSRMLASEIENLCMHRDYYDEISRKCVERAAIFDIHKTVKSYLDIYEKIRSCSL